jgi:hypothetical protein
MTDATTTQQEYAHVLHPEPGDGAPVETHLRYHLARAVGFEHAVEVEVGSSEVTVGRVDRMLRASERYSAEANLALLLIRLVDHDDDLVNAVNYSREALLMGDLAVEELWGACSRRGIDPDLIRAYTDARPVDQGAGAADTAGLDANTPAPAS